MKLNYRGVDYDYIPPTVSMGKCEPINVGSTDSISLSYRGVAHTQPIAIAEATEQPLADLSYRGTAYQLGTSVSSAEVSAAPVVDSVQPVYAASTADKARLLMMGHHRQVKLRQQAMLSRLATKIGMPTEESSHYWGHIQGKVNPSFWATYDRSHTATS